MAITRLAVAKPRTEPPEHLEPPERELWRKLLLHFKLEDVASLAVLQSTLEAHQRARRCRETVDREGEAVLDRFNQRKPHPLLAAERDARAAFLHGMRNLGLTDAGE